MAKRLTTEQSPWCYAECGLDDVYLVGIEIEADPETGEDEPVIPRLEDLHDCIFLAVIAKPGPLTGRELRYLRRHVLWTQAEAAKRLGFNSAQYVCDLESRKGAPLDIRSDFFCRFAYLSEFIRTKSGARKREAKGILANLEEVLEQMRHPKKHKAPRIMRKLSTKAGRWERNLTAA